MGYYIQVPQNKNKADQIAKVYGGEVLIHTPKFEDTPPGKALICVVDNGLFEAAAFCYNGDEFSAFSDPRDGRPKTWVVMAYDKACVLTGYDGR